MRPVRIAACLAACAAALVVATPAGAQGFPTKPIRFIVPFGAGSATDQLARLLGEQISTLTKEPVVVENRAGANGILGADAVAKAPADGYTVMIGTNTTNAANVALFKKLPYDQARDFAPVALIGTVALVAAVTPSLPVNSMADLTALAKKQPGKLNFGFGSASSRMGVEYYKALAGVDITAVPYKSNPPAVTDLIGGQINLMIADMPALLPHVKAGKLRGLAVTTPKRTKAAPDLPTMHEAGVTGYEFFAWFAAYVPAKTPDDVVKRLNELFVTATRTERLRSFFETFGGDIAPSTPAELAKFTAEETGKWARLVKQSGVEPE
jgi:tripartite-type tricarboxylate transporter receptor subunit TctC